MVHLTIPRNWRAGAKPAIPPLPGILAGIMGHLWPLSFTNVRFSGRTPLVGASMAALWRLYGEGGLKCPLFITSGG